MNRDELLRAINRLLKNTGIKTLRKVYIFVLNTV